MHTRCEPATGNAILVHRAPGRHASLRSAGSGLWAWGSREGLGPRATGFGEAGGFGLQATALRERGGSARALRLPRLPPSAYFSQVISSDPMARAARIFSASP